MHKAHLSIDVVCALTAVMLLASAPAVAEEGQVPEGLSATDWSSIRAAYEANRQAVFFAPNAVTSS